MGKEIGINDSRRKDKTVIDKRKNTSNKPAFPGGKATGAWL
jgi:hypothetical protein